MYTTFRFTGLVTLIVTVSLAENASAEVTAERSENGVVVKIDGKLFTEYLTLSGNKPVLWPVIGPTGKPVTRAYPMAEVAGEERDHPHHRSIWFTHGDVNGVMFWGEPRRRDQQGHVIKHREFVSIESGQTARIVARNDWIDAEGTRQCEDERVLTFGTDGENRWIDFDITLKATDRPVTFGDTKEGCFGIRVAGSMTRDQGGRYVNSEGNSTWGAPAAWLDIHGPVDGEVVGIAVMNHPNSFRYPTRWHTRGYGLFAANPFGLGAFQKSETIDGSHTIKLGESVSLRYRLLLHRGNEKEGKVAEAFKAYSKVDK